MIILMDILITLFSLVIAIIPLFKDVIAKPQEGLTQSFIKRINGAGYFIFILALVIIAALFFKDWLSDKNIADEKVKDENKIVERMSKEFEKVLETNHLKYNKETGIILKDTVFLPSKLQKSEALLDIVQDPHYIFDNAVGQTIKIMIGFGNYGEKLVKNLQARNKLIKKTGDTYQITGIEYPRFRQTGDLGLAKDLIEQLQLSYDFRDRTKGDSVYLFLEVKYTNDQNVQQKPIKRIYYMPYPENGANIFNVDADKFQVIQKFLQKEHIW